MFCVYECIQKQQRVHYVTYILYVHLHVHELGIANNLFMHIVHVLSMRSKLMLPRTDVIGEKRVV